MLNAAEAMDYTAESRGITLTSDPTLYTEIQLPNKTIPFSQYQAFKWYALKSVKRDEKGDAIPDASGNLQDKYINTQLIFEYFEYDHDTWL